MRILRVGAPGRERVAVVDGDGYRLLDDLDPAGALPRDPVALLDPRVRDVVEAAITHADGPPRCLAGVRLGPPLLPRQIICVGLNYRDHAAEQGLPWPERPLFFAKAVSALSGPRDPIPLPEDPEAGVDWEVELALVIGRRCRRLRPHEALGAVAGYFVANDVTARRWQKGDGQWFRGKSCDGFFPCGPALVSADEVPNPSALAVRCSVSGAIMQDAGTQQLIHGLPELLAAWSAHATLEPGDVLSTGTPAGVGAHRSPPRFLRDGDEVVCSIEGLGELRNRVVTSDAD